MASLKSLNSFNHIDLSFLEVSHIDSAIKLLLVQSNQVFEQSLVNLDLEVIFRKSDYLKSLKSAQFKEKLLQGNSDLKYRHTVYKRRKPDAPIRQEDLLSIDAYIVYYAITFYLLDQLPLKIHNQINTPETYIHSGVCIDLLALEKSRSFTQLKEGIYRTSVNDFLDQHVENHCCSHFFVSFLRLDIQSFFLSIKHEKIFLSILKSYTGRIDFIAENIQKSITLFFSSLMQRTIGFPSSSNNIASFILASIYLNLFDQYINTVREKYSVFSYSRWVDDMTFMMVHPMHEEFDKISDITYYFFTEISCFLEESLDLKFHPLKRHYKLLYCKKRKDENPQITEVVEIQKRIQDRLIRG